MNHELIKTEVRYRFSRSSGKGGQNVNKVATRVELLWDLPASQALSQEEKGKVRAQLSGRINKEGVLSVAVEQSRSQRRNRDEALRRLYRLLAHTLAPEKARSGPKILHMPHGLRLRLKKAHSQKKALRKKGDYHPDSDGFLLSLQA
jgi:ribosome-associated protein